MDPGLRVSGRRSNGFDTVPLKIEGVSDHVHLLVNLKTLDCRCCSNVLMVGFARKRDSLTSTGKKGT